MSEKHKKIAKAIADRIISGDWQPGIRLPTQQELCSEFKVSRSYIHEVFNILDSRGLITRRAGRGVFVNSAKPSRKLRCIGIICGHSRNAEFAGGLFYELISELQDKNYKYHIMRTYDFSEKNIMPWARSNDVEALLFIRPFRQNVVKLDIPMLLLENYSLIPGISSVDIDYFNGIFDMLRRIHAAGYRKIDFVFSNGSKHDPFIRGAVTRCLHEFPDLKLRQHDVIHGRPFTPDDHNEIYGLVQGLIERNDLPEIFLGQHDWTCFRILEMMRQNKISVPEQIGVGSLCSIPELKLEPKLTSLLVDEALLARRALAALAGLFAEEKESCTAIVTMQYIERESLKLGGLK